MKCDADWSSRPKAHRTWPGEPAPAWAAQMVDRPAPALPETGARCRCTISAERAERAADWIRIDADLAAGGE